MMVVERSEFFESENSSKETPFFVMSHFGGQDKSVSHKKRKHSKFKPGGDPLRLIDNETPSPSNSGSSSCEDSIIKDDDDKEDGL